MWDTFWFLGDGELLLGSSRRWDVPFVLDEGALEFGLDEGRTGLVEVGGKGDGRRREWRARRGGRCSG